MSVRYPAVVVPLFELEAEPNAFEILGRVRREMRRHGISDAEICAYLEAATSADYRHLVDVTLRTVTVDTSHVDRRVNDR